MPHELPRGEVGALQAADNGEAHALGEVRVLAVGLLSTAPARVAEDVDIGCPHAGALVTLHRSGMARLSVLDAHLIGHLVEDAVNQRVVPRGCHHHGDGEDGAVTVAPHAVQPFAPPFVHRDVEA